MNNLNDLLNDCFIFLFFNQAGVFEVLLVRLACMFDSQSNSMICLNGLVLRREALHSASNARFLLDSMFDFAERLNSLRLTDHEVGLFCAVVVIAAGKLKTIQFLIFPFFKSKFLFYRFTNYKPQIVISFLLVIISLKLISQGFVLLSYI